MRPAAPWRPRPRRMRCCSAPAMVGGDRRGPVSRTSLLPPRRWRAQGEVIAPDPARAERYARDYRVFLAMHEQRRALDAIT